MSLAEFEFIDHYLRQHRELRNDVVLGIGDDAAIIDFPKDKQLVSAMDTLVNGVHFLESWSASDIAYKALMVNLSDFAAMAADPAWVMLSLSLPELNEKWLQAFCDQLFQLLDQFNLQLIGGDTTQGPLTISLTVLGFVEPDKALTRQGAQVGDLIYVTGQLGAAALAVDVIYEKAQVKQKDHSAIMQALLKPQPRLQEAKAISDYATAAIDISDGLVADLQHILTASGVGAKLELERVPIHPVLLDNVALEQARTYALTGGDDYELCFTVPGAQQSVVESALKQYACGYQQIGVIESKQGIRCIDEQGKTYSIEKTGYQHFS